MEDLNRSSKVIEPSAGQGAIINAIFKRGIVEYVYYCELMDINKSFLSKIQGANYINDDFLCLGTDYNNVFDRVIANPPFTKNQDIDHIRKMYEVCKPGGRIVTIASKHWQISNNKKETDFRNWLNQIEAEIIPIDPGEFKESGTTIATCLIIIDK